MRLPYWLATVMGILPVLAGGGEATADGPWSQPGPAHYGTGTPEEQFGPPFGPPTFSNPSFDPGFGGYPPPPADYPTNTPLPVESGGTAIPPGASPWPQISPYDHAFDQHYQKDGLWHRMLSNDFDRTIIVEGLLTFYRRPSGNFLGSPDVFLATATGGTGGTTTGTSFPILNLRTSVFSDNQFEEPTGGVRVRLGDMRPDGSGLEFTGFWAGSNERSRFFGRPDANRNNPSTLLTTNPGLPLEDTLPPGSLLSDSIAPFDMNVFVDFDQEAFGGSLTWYSSRAWDLRALKLRPTMGIRYFGIRETLDFRGVGSGLPTAPQFEGSFTSKARNHLIGPEVGVRFDIGGDRLKIINETKIAVAGVYEDLDLTSRGLGNGLRPGFDPSVTTSDQQNHGHVSPILEQTISLEANLFGYVPVLKNVELLDRARFRFGYTLTWIGEIQRPSSIRYLSPRRGGPQIEFDRTDWYMNNFNFGVSWNY